MSLNKRFARNIKNNRSFYICIILLTAIVICMHVGFHVSYKDEVAYIDNMREEVNLEDGQFTTYLPLGEEEIDELRDEYGVDIEGMRYIDMEGEAGEESEADSTIVRIFAPTERIDRYVVTEGEDIQSEDDILLSPLFAQRNGLKIGKEITLRTDNQDAKAHTYHISGYCVKLDYMFCLKNYTDTFSNTDEFGVAVISAQAFDELPEEEIVSYHVIRYNGAEEREVREALYDKYYTTSYIAKDNNNRITTADDQLAELENTTQMILPMSVILIVVLIAVVLGRKVKNEQKMLGVLSALGYRRYELALHYSVFGAVCGVIGGILGVLSSIPLLEPMAELAYENKLEPLPVNYVIELPDVIYAIAFPTAAYIAAVFVTALLIMRTGTINMIKGLSGRTKKHSLRMIGMKASFRTKYRIRALFGNLSRTLVVLFGLGLGGMLLAFGYACVDSLEYYCNTAVRESGKFEYEYFLSGLYTQPVDDGTEALSASFAVDGYADLVTLMGLENKDYLTVETPDGADIELKNGEFYISEMGSHIYGVEKGDTLTVYDVASMKEYEIAIADVFHNGNQCLIVSDTKTTSELLGIPEGTYNVVMSDKQLAFDDSEILKEVRKTDIEESLRNNILKGMHQSMALIVGFGMLINIIVVFLMVNVLLTESTTSISMLKVLGYRDREINRIVTHIYHLILPFGIAIGILLGSWLNEYNFIVSTETYNTFVEPHMSAVSVIKCIAITVVSYVLALLLLGRKVGRVSMVESLKNNRE